MMLVSKKLYLPQIAKTCILESMVYTLMYTHVPRYVQSSHTHTARLDAFTIAVCCDSRHDKAIDLHKII